MICKGLTHSYCHDISDDGFSSVWMGGDDTITSFSLEVTLYDDNVGYATRYWGVVNRWWLLWWHYTYGWVTVTHPDGTEGAYVSFGFEPHEFTFDNGSETYTGNVWGELDIWQDGTLDVRVSSDFGDFYLASSVLTVNGDDGTEPAPVPEPATLMLLGSGLIGLAGFRKKTKK